MERAGVEREEYQGYVIESAPRGLGVHWFGVHRGSDEYFEFTIHIATPNPWQGTPPVDRSEFAQQYGRRWVHGVIDLGRFQTGRAYREIRAPEWNPQFESAEFSDGDLGDELLIALERLDASRERTGQAMEIDLEGIAGVLLLDPARILTVMKRMVDEGLAERASDGHHQITPAGIAYMRQHDIRRR